MPNDNQRPIIIVKKEDGGGEGRHGGAWKIAYADFMTAMMAFFLLMWLINATSEEQKKGIAQFFNPMADKSASTAPTDSLLEASPLTSPTSIKLAKNSDVEANSSGNGSGKTNDGSSTEQSAPSTGANTSDDITSGLTSILQPGSPSIIPIGGPQTGAAKLGSKVGSSSQDRLSNGSETAASIQEQKSIDAAIEGIKSDIQKDPNIQDVEKNLRFEVGSDEIRIELTDTDHQAMFDTGSVAPNKTASFMLAAIGKWLSPLPEKVSILGETDGIAYHVRKGNASGLSNWTLSEMRADKAREILVKSGYPDKNIESVSGLADRNLADPSHPDAPENRRIVIILHRRNPISSSLLQHDKLAPMSAQHNGRDIKAEKQN